MEFENSFQSSSFFLLLTSLKKLFGKEAVTTDPQYPIIQVDTRVGTAVVGVPMLGGDRPLLHVRAFVAEDVRITPALLLRLMELNATEKLGSFGIIEQDVVLDARQLLTGSWADPAGHEWLKVTIVMISGLANRYRKGLEEDGIV